MLNFKKSISILICVVMVVLSPLLYSIYAMNSNVKCTAQPDFDENYIVEEMQNRKGLPIENTTETPFHLLRKDNLHQISSWTLKENYSTREPRLFEYTVSDKIVYDVIFDIKQEAEITIRSSKPGILLCPVKVTFKARSPFYVSIHLKEDS